MHATQLPNQFPFNSTAKIAPPECTKTRLFELNNRKIFWGGDTAPQTSPQWKAHPHTLVTPLSGMHWLVSFGDVLRKRFTTNLSIRRLHVIQWPITSFHSIQLQQYHPECTKAHLLSSKIEKFSTPSPVGDTYLSPHPTHLGVFTASILAPTALDIRAFGARPPNLNRNRRHWTNEQIHSYNQPIKNFNQQDNVQANSESVQCCLCLSFLKYLTCNFDDL